MTLYDEKLNELAELEFEKTIDESSYKVKKQSIKYQIVNGSIMTNNNSIIIEDIHTNNANSSQEGTKETKGNNTSVVNNENITQNRKTFTSHCYK